MNKIFVACKWEFAEQAREIMVKLKSMGYEITRDWTTAHAEPDSPEGLQQLTEISIDDVNGVRNCDIVVAYLPKDDLRYKGLYSECGMALALRKMVLLVGDIGDNQKCWIYLYHPLVMRFSSLEDLYEHLLDLKVR